MPSAQWIRVIIALAAGAVFGLSLLTGDSIDEQGLRWLGGVTGGITLLLLAFDRWIWKWPGVRFLSELSGRRVIHGTWRGTFDYEANENGQPGTSTFYLAVKQTYSDADVRCYFPRTGSTSRSLTATLLPDGHHHTLHFLYSSKAEAPDRDGNRPHEGACTLAVVGRPVEELTGSYYTDRLGRGRMSSTAHSQRVAGSLRQAERLTYGDRHSVGSNAASA